MSANAGAIRAGAAFVELYAVDDKLRKVLDQASAKLRGFGAGIVAIGASIAALGAVQVATATAALLQFAEAGDELHHMSENTGVAVEALSSIGFAAKLSGLSLEDLQVGFKKMSVSINEAVHGSAEATAHLQALHLTAVQLRNLAPEDQFRLLAQRISELPSQAERAAAAVAFFGKSGTRELSLFKDLVENENWARGHGMVSSAADVEMAHQFHQELIKLDLVLRKITSQIGAALAPVLKGLVTWLVEGVAAVLKFVKAHRLMIIVGVALSAVLVGIGTAIAFVGAAFFALAAGISVASWALGMFNTMLALADILAAPWVLIAIGVAAGLVAIAAAAALAAGVFFTFTKTGRDMLAGLGWAFGDLYRSASASIDGIQAALKHGDLTLAWEIAVTSMKVAWLSALAEMENGLVVFGEAFVDIYRLASMTFGLMLTQVNSLVNALEGLAKILMVVAGPTIGIGNALRGEAGDRTALDAAKADLDTLLERARKLTAAKVEGVGVGGLTAGVAISASSFNPFAAPYLSRGDTFQEIAENTKRTADKLDEIAKKPAAEPLKIG